jgi:oligopeptide/dipeptide ABC transporter ATP-binding protein
MYAGRIVEAGSAAAVFSAPRIRIPAAAGEHPVAGPEQDRLQTIPGMVPSLSNLPAGCRFHPRCPEARPACCERAPATFEVGPAHRAACIALNGYRHAG